MRTRLWSDAAQFPTVVFGAMFRYIGSEIGTLKDLDSARIVLDIQIADPAAREAHLATLRKMFAQ
ncbi:MAG: hypothetical protein JO067_01645 [Cupriavidus sp.]|nr:hypothetical protein [Cupriavidus sp.]